MDFLRDLLKSDPVLAVVAFIVVLSIQKGPGHPPDPVFIYSAWQAA